MMIRLDKKIYVRHWQSLMDGLRRCSKEVIWVTLPAILPFRQMDSGLTAEFNEAVFQMLAETYPEVSMLDVFKMSQLDHMRVDALHMNGHYDRAVADIMLNFATR